MIISLETMQNKSEEHLFIIIYCFLLQTVHVGSTSRHVEQIVIIKQSNSRYVTFNNNSRD